MSILNYEFLDPEVYRYNDEPRVWHNAVGQIVTWEDAENALNAPWNYITTVLGDDGKRLDLESVEEPWFGKGVYKKTDLFAYAKDGWTVNISQYGHGNSKVEELLTEFETRFDGCADCHIFMNLGTRPQAKSFHPHWDQGPTYIMQMDGETRWVVYENRASALIPSTEEYPYVPSQDELTIQLDTVLKAGDVLYLPQRKLHKAYPSKKRLSISVPIWCPKRCECSDRESYQLF